MALNFEPIHLEKQSAYRELFDRCSQKSSDYSLINLWGWAEEHGLSWAWDDPLVWIRQRRQQTANWAPIGDWEAVDWLKRMARLGENPLRFMRVPEALVALWRTKLGERVSATEARAHWDYLYAIQELVQLSGNRFHSKKNLVNQFVKNHPYEYISFGPAEVGKALAMQASWCQWRDCESHEMLSAENRVIEKVLGAWERLANMTGGALLVDREMVAYTIAEPLDADTVLIHFEKANPEFRGAYQAINQMFLAHAAGPATIANREQDLGDEGLRKAKLSYNPSGFLKKYDVTIAL